MDGSRGALWQPCQLLEEGCHSAGFVTTIHLRHHLLLSIGWRFSLFAPVMMLEVCHISNRMSIARNKSLLICNLKMMRFVEN